MWPTLFHIFGIPISPYGLLLAVGLLVGVVLALRRAHQVGVQEDAILDVAFFGILAGFAGGRLGFILTHIPEFMEDPLPILLDRSGFQFMGGLITGTLVSVWIIRRRGERPLAVGDVIMPSIALGHFLGRIGCFCAGCCYGRVCHPPFEGIGVRFPRLHGPEGHPEGSYAVYDHIEHGLLPPDATASLPVWPTQLFEATGNFAIFLALLWLWTRRRWEGQIFTAYLGLYGVLRFCVEFFRGDADRGYLAGLSTSQWLSLGALGAALILWRRLRNDPQSRANAANAAPLPPREDVAPQQETI